MNASEIVERLERGEVGREIDAEIGDFIDPPSPLRMRSLGEFKAKLRAGGSRTDAPPYSTSLDAAVALKDRVLPGAPWRVGHMPDDLDNLLAMVIRQDLNKAFKATAPTPAAALVAALLRAGE